MASPSPSDLCWVLKAPPRQQWIAPLLRTAIEEQWEQARQIAEAALGDAALAVEMMERAIGRTLKQLADREPLNLDGVSQILSQCYKAEIRRQRIAQNGVRVLGTAADLDLLQAADGYAAIESSIDLGTILRQTSPEIRSALLMRIGGCESWGEVAAKTGRTKSAIRMSCKREMQRIRKRLGIFLPEK